MIIKSHIRGGYRSAADYLKDIGKNEKTRLVKISDHDAKDLDEAFHKMWEVADDSKVRKPLHHISINPFRDERLTDDQVLKIAERCEQKYGYKPGDHQRVIVEHIKDGRQHFHVFWNRVSMATGRAVWPGLHWNKSKEAAREMEEELGLKRPLSKREKRRRTFVTRAGKTSNGSGRTAGLNKTGGAAGLSKTRPARKATARTKKSLAPVKPMPGPKGWPKAAVIDWEVWGHKNPARFFALWPELAPDGFVPFSPRQPR